MHYVSFLVLIQMKSLVQKRICRMKKQTNFSKPEHNRVQQVYKITEPNALGLNVLQEMEDELAKLKDACNTKTANKVKQLDAYVQLSHLDIEKFPCTPANANIDPSARLNEIRNVIRSVKSLVSKRSAIVTMTEFVLNAVQEVRWFRKYDECDNAIADVTHPFHERTIKAERLSCTIEGLLNSLKPKVLAWEATENEPFMFDKDKLLEMIKGLESEFKKEHPPRSARTPDVEFPVPLRVIPLAADEVDGNADSRSLHVSLAADEVDRHADSRSLHVSPAADEVDGHAASRSLHVSPAADEVDGHAASRSLHVSPAAEVAESSPLSVSPYSPEVAEGAASSPSSYMSSPYQSDPNDSDYVP
uniref:Uncharacterized protein n=1 Tax=Oryza meridionalis TaxID=40149 RepID=A0A0E0DUA6_9ORYZ